MRNFRPATAAAMIWLGLVTATQAQVRYVAGGGADTGDCTSDAAPCATLLYALGRAGDGDTVRIGQGTYPGAVTVTRSVTLEGDYGPGFVRAPQRDPARTVLDGGGNARPLTITGAATAVTLDGLRIANGDASAAAPRPGAGGGVLVTDGATLTAAEVRIEGNVANRGAGAGLGGGLAVINGQATLNGVTVLGNSAKAGGTGPGLGGALYLAGADGQGRAVLQLTNCEILVNVANASPAAGGGDEGSGGGLYVGESADTQLTFFENAWEQNVARAAAAGAGPGRGGALAIRQAQRAATLSVEADQYKVNIANAGAAPQDGLARGGAVWLEAVPPGSIQAMLLDTSLLDNVAKAGSGTGNGQGGALWASQVSLAWAGGAVIANTAATAGAETGEGGALYLSRTPLIGSEIQLQYNAALRGGGGARRGRGGAIAVRSEGAASGAVTLENSFVVDNIATDGGDAAGAALYLEDRSAGASFAGRYLTVAQPQPTAGDQAVHIEAGSLELANTIVAGFATGVRAATGASVHLLPRNLFAVETDTAGTVTGAENILHGAPQFQNAAGGVYYLGAGSAAIDAGAELGPPRDLEGDPRPLGEGFDIGADEYVAGQPTRTAVPTQTPVPSEATPTATPPPGGSCAADCDGDGQVTVNELVSAVNISLGATPLSQCVPADADGDGGVAINELIAGVARALDGCG
jgi:hypothetical protein